MSPFQAAAKKLKEFFRPPRDTPGAGPRQALNITRGTVIASRLELAGTGESRRKGLLGRDRLAPGEGLWIAPCESVHTFFMRFAIDLVYLDRKYQVKKVRHAVAPWRVSACFSAHSVLELPAGTIGISQTACGDTVLIETAAIEAKD